MFIGGDVDLSMQTPISRTRMVVQKFRHVIDLAVNYNPTAFTSIVF